MQKVYLYLIYILFQLNCIIAQVSYNYKLYTTEDGLISNTCYKIFQDSKGYLWVSHDNGVSRFNGKNSLTSLIKITQKGIGNLTIFWERKFPNSVHGSSPDFLYDLSKGNYIGHDSVFIISQRNKNNGVYLDKPIVDHNGYKIYLLDKRSKYIRDTIYYSFMGKYDYALLPNKLNNKSIEFISSQNKIVYFKTFDTVSNEYSYMTFIKGKLN